MITTRSELATKSDPEFKYVLINVLTTLANNAGAFKRCLPKYIYQLFRQLIHIYCSNPKSKADNVVLVFITKNPA